MVRLLRKSRADFDINCESRLTPSWVVWKISARSLDGKSLNGTKAICDDIMVFSPHEEMVLVLKWVSLARALRILPVVAVGPALKQP